MPPLSHSPLRNSKTTSSFRKGNCSSTVWQHFFFFFLKQARLSAFRHVSVPDFKKFVF